MGKGVWALKSSESESGPPPEQGIGKNKDPRRGAREQKLLKSLRHLLEVARALFLGFQPGIHQILRRGPRSMKRKS